MAKKQKRSRKKGTKKKSGLLSNLILILAVCVFVFSGYQLYQIFSEYHEGKKEYEEIRELVIQEEPKKEPEEQKEPEVQPRFTVDFATLQQMNPDTVGWIRFEEPSEISYPVVKGRDNEEYLTRTFEANDNKLGTLFVDKDNTGTFTDRNTIIYGHNMKNGTMFAKLLKFREESFLKKHHVIILYTPKKTMYLKVISSYAVKAQDQMPITFANEMQKKEYITKIRRMSEPSIKLDDKKIDRIYTFVTCSYERDDNRTYVHAVEE